jgi:hypothetical protein
MKQTAINWLMDEAMKLVVQYIQGTLNENTLDDVIYEIGTKAKEMEKEQIMDAYRINPNNENWSNSGIDYYNETFKSE